MYYPPKEKNLKSKYVKLCYLAGFVLSIAGCASPKILKTRADVPPPVVAPSGEKTDKADEKIQLSPNEQFRLGQPQIKELPELDKSDKVPVVEPKAIKYKVKKGESFWSISRKFGVGMKELAAYNNMDVKKPLKAGITLKIPPGGRLVETPKAEKGEPEKEIKKLDGDTDYTVRPGDSLWKISRKFGTTVKAVADANGLTKDSVLKVGQELYIPGKKNKESGKKTASTKTTKSRSSKNKVKDAPKKSEELTKEDSDLLNQIIGETKKSDNEKKPTPNYLPHTVKKGDTWNTISEMYGVSIKDLKKANPKIASEKLLTPETVINIPEI